MLDNQFQQSEVWERATELNFEIPRVLCELLIGNVHTEFQIHALMPCFV